MALVIWNVAAAVPNVALVILIVPTFISNVVVGLLLAVLAAVSHIQCISMFCCFLLKPVSSHDYCY